MLNYLTRLAATLAVATFSIATVLMAVVSPALAGACPNEQLRIENSSTALPECRAYEQVTQADKNGQHLQPEGFSAPDGTAIVYDTISALPGSPTGGSAFYVSRRGVGGWVTTPLAPGNANPESQNGGALGAVGADFSTVFLGSDDDLVPNDHDANFNDVFAVGAEGSLAWISQGPEGGAGVGPPFNRSEEPSDVVGGASANLTHVVFEVAFGGLLSTDTHTSGGEIYDRVDESATELVGVLPNETVPACGASLGDQQGAGVYRSVSEEGTVVFFTSTGSACFTETSKQLYARINDEHTLEVSSPAEGVVDPYGEQAASYVLATPQGTAVLFTSKGVLTSNANTNGDTTEDLYECVIVEVAGKPTCKLTDLSSAGLTDSNGSQVQGVIGASENDGVVYFVAKGKLTSQAIEGADNLYVWHEGQLGYITALNDSDNQDWEGLIQERTAEVTPDGEHMVLTSVESITGYNNAGHDELYLYDLAGNNITCVSCGPTGSVAVGTSFFGISSGGNFAPDSYLSNDGSNVVFASTESLTGTNTHDEGAVYEWHGGQLSLIAGAGTRLVGATPSGDDIFFDTAQSLSPSDKDGGEADIYDARVDGGFPAPSPPEKQCESNVECRGAATSPSILTPTSLAAGPSGSIMPPASKLAAVKLKTKASTTVQELAAALKMCSKDKSRSKRKVCRASAHKKYGLTIEKKSKTKRTDKKGH